MTYICLYKLIHYVVAAPRVVTHPTDTSAAAPFSALFSCSVEVYGNLTITWYRNNRGPVPKKAYLTLVPLVILTTSILTIPNVTIDDVGTYHCVVWANMLAAQSRAAKLFLAGKMHLFLCVMYGTYIYIFRAFSTASSND